MKKKIISLLGATALTAALLTGCGGDSDDKTITVAASATPHAEILEQAKPLLEAKGYTLRFRFFRIMCSQTM